MLFNGNRYQCNGLSDHKEQFLCGKCAFVLTKCPLHDYILINKHQKLTGMVASVDDNDVRFVCVVCVCVRAYIHVQIHGATMYFVGMQ